MATEYVSGWNDEKHVYLIRRDGEAMRVARVPAMWSTFFRGFDDKDRATMSRLQDVTGVSVDVHGYTRVDFATMWARREVNYKIREMIKGRQYAAMNHAGVDTDMGVFEGDVTPLRRLLSDNPNVAISGSFRCGWFDLETDSRSGINAAVEGNVRILSWAVSNLDRSDAVVDVLEADTDDAERALLVRFYEHIARYDVMLAWSGDSFDFPGLENRTRKIRVMMPSANGARKPPFWNRWCWLDALEVFKKYNQAHDSGEERTSFSLNSIANHILGEGKDVFDASKTWEAWEAGGAERERLAAYNLRDTTLLPRIEEKTGFVALHLAVCQVTRCFPDSASLGAAQQGDGYLLRLGAEIGYRFPTKWRRDDLDGLGFAGAYVMEPKRLGLIENVHVCDFASLYPSIMRSWNMSADTIVPRSRVNELPTCKLPDRAVHFRTDVRGIFPRALDDLVTQRGAYTKRSDAAEPGSEEWHRYKRLSSAFKIITNSFYGIVGSPYTRFFDKTIAEGVTQTGAWLIKHVARVSESAGLDPFYGDTDSVFVQGDAGAFGRVVESLNASWPEVLKGMGCTTCLVKLEFEKSFSKLVLVSAKRYAGKFSMHKGKPAPDDMKPEVKGLEYKRGDSLRLAREMQAEAIALLHRTPMPDVAEMREFVARWRERVLEKPLELADVILSQSVKDLDEYALRYTTDKCGFKTGVGKSAVACGHYFGATSVKEGPSKCPRCKTERKVASQPTHVRVAHMLKDRGESIVPGTRIEYLIVLPGESDDQKKLVPVPAHDPGAFERIDRGYYWEDRILAPTRRVLEAVYPGIEWGEAKPVKVKDIARVASKAKKKRDVKTADLFQSWSDHDDDANA